MKVLVVLGNRLNDDGTMSDIQMARLNKALDVLRGGGIDKVILSGGMPNKKAGKTEAEAMQGFLLDSGVSGSMIVLEDKSNTTRENAIFCAPIIKALGAETVVLCTSEAHVARWFLSAKKLFERRLKRLPGVKLELALCK